MKQIIIPNTELTMSSIGLGTASAGLTWAGAAADRILDTYLDLGGNVIDTARVYSDWVPGETGRSERVVGDWLQRSGKRQDVVLVTKGGHPDLQRPDADIHRSRMTAAAMRHDLELSLTALHTDAVDLYFYHRDDRGQPVAALIEVMETFRREGKIRYYGCSNWQVDRIAEAAAYCESRGYRGFVADEALFNLGVAHKAPGGDDTLVALTGKLADYHAAQPALLAMPYSGVANGFFHHFAKGGAAAVAGSDYATPANLARAEQAVALAHRTGATITQVVFGFFAVQPFACLPLFAPRNLAQLEDTLGAAGPTLTPADFAFAAGD
ncbi:aldo/keto reductase [Lacticaseibacillus parakribbianus]|uniref:aldo/keto reductase n=1 Tax=Lacticaseibacillus parakribbianus TaxID=2970927 RepID=UPI0021CB91EC|nr:aldo/keto reductase [Lacticaseibacillus parakribbianus]